MENPLEMAGSYPINGSLQLGTSVVNVGFSIDVIGG
jgi:hypothetical protein